jgi:hypothetical protein
LSAVAAALLYYLKISRDESSKKDKRTKELQDKLKKRNESHGMIMGTSNPSSYRYKI